jgi:hypothetical protein
MGAGTEAPWTEDKGPEAEACLGLIMYVMCWLTHNNQGMGACVRVRVCPAHEI